MATPSLLISSDQTLPRFVEIRSATFQRKKTATSVSTALEAHIAKTGST